MTYSPTTIDLSRVPAPDAVEALDAEAFDAAFMARFTAYWNAQRAVDPTLPEFTITALKANPASIVSRTFSYYRVLDRARVNDAVRAVLAPLAKGADLDNVAARANVQRLVVIPADPVANTPAVMESDAALLRRYLLSFDRPAAGSASRYLFDAWTAWPQMGDAAVNGWAVHGRRGDVDLVVTGPGGRNPTPSELASLRAKVMTDENVPEATAAAVIPATRHEYAVRQVIRVLPGPDSEIVRLEALARVKAATDSRTLIGSAAPRDLIAGAAFGPNVVSVEHISPAADIPADPYAVPVATAIVIELAGLE